MIESKRSLDYFKASEFEQERKIAEIDRRVYEATLSKYVA